MDLHLALDQQGDLATGVYRSLRDAVEDGRLVSGDRLPSTRELARDLGIARNTVAAAYDALVAEGYAEGRRGSGTYVTVVAPPPIALRRVAAAPTSVPAAPTSASSAATSDMRAAPEFDLRIGLPDPRAFPAAAWRRALADAVDEAIRDAPGYGDPSGDPGLRASIARHVSVSRGVRVAADTMVVTAGAQGAFDLLARCLVSPGDVVVVEDPGYPHARASFAAAGARLVGVPVDGDGLVTDALPNNARAAVVTPAHQMPMGVTLSAARRAALLDWADRTGAVIIEDDYDSEFRHAARPLEPLQRLDRGGRVVYVGSFSKTLLPMLRMGFLVAPPALLPALREARRLAGWQSEAVTQLALRRLIDDGTFGRHLRRTRRLYRVRHDRLLAAISRDLAPWLVPNPAAAGLHVAALAQDGIDPERIRRVVAGAAALGVAVESLDAYAVERTRVQAGLAMGFGSIDEGSIDGAVRRLARAFAAF
jgi:GntR family transcriptional regulator/MocR family aminotransferase